MELIAVLIVVIVPVALIMDSLRENRPVYLMSAQMPAPAQMVQPPGSLAGQETGGNGCIVFLALLVMFVGAAVGIMIIATFLLSGAA